MNRRKDISFKKVVFNMRGSRDDVNQNCKFYQPWPKNLRKAARFRTAFITRLIE